MLIEDLAAKWLALKRQEQEANRQRLAIEKTMCELAKEQLPKQGTVTLGNVKVSTGYNRSWDSKTLTDIYRTKPVAFPFLIEWKEDRRMMQKLESESPELAEIFISALTIKEKKPTFVYIGESDE